MWTNHKGFVTIRRFAVEFLIFVKVWLVDFVTIGSFVVELFLSKYDTWYFHFVGFC
jgi:hypothetical protein